MLNQMGEKEKEIKATACSETNSNIKPMATIINRCLKITFLLVFLAMMKNVIPHSMPPIAL